MRYIASSFLILFSFTHAIAQGDSERKRVNENQLLGRRILEEHGLKYYDSGSYHIVFDWKKTRPYLIDFASFEKTLRETTYHGEKLKFLKQSLCVSSSKISGAEIGNTIFKNKEGKEVKIKDVGRVERLTRICTGVVGTPYGLFINSRTINNEPEIFLYSNNSISEFSNLKNYIVFDYSPSSHELLVSKFDIDPFGDSMSHEIFTYNLKSFQLRKQGDFGWIYGEPKFSTVYDSIIVNVMEKNSDGVGSHDVRKSMKVK